MNTQRTFVIGGLYFSLFYHDEHLRLPEIETLIYLGENVGSSDGEPIHSFQTAASFQRNGLWTHLSLEQRDAIALRLFGNDALDPICDLDGLIVQLNELSSKLGRRPAA